MGSMYGTLRNPGVPITSGRAVIASAVALLASMLGLVLGAAPASAHATFVSPSTAAVGSDVDFTLDVPHERDEGTINVLVRIKVPDGWRAVSCDPFPTWTCSTGGGEIDFTKDPGAAPAQDETFRFVAHAGSSGRITFPVVQIYSTGENVLWQDTAIVTAVGESESTTVPSSDPPPQTIDPAAAGGDDATTSSTSAAGSDSAAPSDGGSTDPGLVAAPDRSSRTAPGASEVAGEVTGGVQEDAGSSSTLLIILGAVLVVGSAATTTLVVMRRRSGRG